MKFQICVGLLTHCNPHDSNNRLRQGTSQQQPTWSPEGNPASLMMWRAAANCQFWVVLSSPTQAMKPADSFAAKQMGQEDWSIYIYLLTRSWFSTGDSQSCRWCEVSSPEYVQKSAERDIRSWEGDTRFAPLLILWPKTLLTIRNPRLPISFFLALLICLSLRLVSCQHHEDKTRTASPSFQVRSSQHRMVTESLLLVLISQHDTYSHCYSQE